MIRITTVTLFPELHQTFLNESLIKRAIDAKILEANVVSIRDFVEPKERVDAPCCGPGAGMVIRAEVMERVLHYVHSTWGNGIHIFFTPQGIPLRQPVLQQFADKHLNNDQKEQSNSGSADAHIILVCPRYEGVDQRVEDQFADYLLSLGDYVLMGGDLPAQVFLEGVLRLVPGVVGKQESVEHDSFSGPYLDHEPYGLPQEWQGKAVPEILSSGHHEKINAWRKDVARKKTIERRFDAIQRYPEYSNAERDAIMDVIPSHYVVLMHDQVLIGRREKKPGTTSVTTIDLHDIARASTTYGVKKVFIVTPLEDQHTALNKFLSFWRSKDGADYNKDRYNAVASIEVVHCFEEVLDHVEKDTEKRPLSVVTSALNYQDLQGEVKPVDYHGQGVVWKQERPVLLVFGTGQGLLTSFIEQSDYLLTPINGFTNYNHLSVRSAVSIILDRWLGHNPQLF